MLRLNKSVNLSELNSSIIDLGDFFSPLNMTSEGALLHTLSISPSSYSKPSIVNNTEDDYAGDTSTTGRLPLDGSIVNGSIEVAGDKDWFRFDVEAGQTVWFSPRFIDAHRPIPSIFDSSGNLIATTPTSNGLRFLGVEDFFEWTSETSGTYYVQITDSGIEDYQLFALTSLDDNSDFISPDLNEISIGDTVTGRYSKFNDTDFFRFTADAGDAVTINMADTLSNYYNRGARYLPDINLYDAEGNFITGYTGIGTWGFRLEESGEYYLSIRSTGIGQSEDEYNFTLEQAADSISDTRETAFAMPTDGSVISDSIAYHGDLDWFSFDLESGETLRINLEGSASSARYSLYYWNGSSLVTIANHNQLTTNTINYEIQNSGQYYLEVKALSTRHALVDYDISAIVTNESHANNIGEAILISPGTEISGAMGFSANSDWVGFYFEQGETYSIEIDFEGNSMNFRGSSILESISSTQFHVFEVGSNSYQILYHAEFTGYHYLGLRPNGPSTSYNLQSTQIYDDTLDGTFVAPRTLEINGAALSTRTHYEGDQDYFTVNVVEGEVYDVIISNLKTRDDRPSSAFTLYDESGAVFFTNNILGSVDADRYTFEARYTGQVTFSLTSYDGTTSSRTDLSDYNVQIGHHVSNGRDLAATVNTTGSIIVDGTGGIFERDFYFDEDWFEIDIDAGEVIEFSINGDADTTLKGTLKIYDSSGNLVSSIAPDRTTSTDTSRYDLFQFDQGGTYYVSLKANVFSPMTITARSVTDDYSNGMTSTGRLNLNGATQLITSHFEADIDWFRISVVAGQEYTLLGTDFLSGVDFRLLNENGQIIADSVFQFSAALGTHNERLDFISEYTGDYYVMINGYHPTTDVTLRFSSEHYEVNSNPLLSGTLFGDNIMGTNNDDNIDSSAGNDIIYGLAGNDTLSSSRGTAEIYGGEGDDVIFAYGSSDNVLDGGTGDDEISSGAGNDYILGGSGNDLMMLGGGTDLGEGGLGSDEIHGGSGVDRIYGQEGDDHLFGDAGQDHLYGGADNDRLFGGDDADTLYGEVGHDILSGDDGDDQLWGELGNDTLHGGAGYDHLFGGHGEDILIGGAGADILEGGAGRDTFVVHEDMFIDRIIDFDINLDFIRLDVHIFQTFDELLAATSEYSGFIEIDFGSHGSLRIDGISRADLTTSHFRYDGDSITGGNFYRRGLAYDEGDPKLDPDHSSASSTQSKADIFVSRPSDIDENIEVVADFTDDIVGILTQSENTSTYFEKLDWLYDFMHWDIPHDSLAEVF